MNIFTKDDYRKIQAWLKANSIKDSDLTSVNDTIPEEDTLVLVQKINGILSNVKISIKNLLNSTLSKVIIDTIIANAVKVNNTLTVTASNVKIDNEKGTTLQDVLDYFEGNKLNRHTDDTFDGNLTVKKNITIEGNIKSHDGTTTVEADLEATGEITDGHGNLLNDVNSAAKQWSLEYQDPQQDEPTVRAKYVLKDYRGVPKGSVIKIYKDSAITNVYLGTVEDTCNPDTGEVTKNPIHNNNEALSIVYRLDTGKYSLVNVPIKMFTTEAEFDKYRGLGVTSNGQIFIKLASDVESSNYLHFNELGEITANGIEARILRDLGDIITSVAGDRTMWGVYKEHEGTQETSTPNDGSRWGEFKRAEEIREQIADSTHQVFSDNWDAQDDDPENPQDRDVADEASYAYNWKSTDSTRQGNLGDLVEEFNELSTEVSKLENEVIYDVTANNNGAIFASLSELLLSEHISTLIPISVRHGGMSIRFMQGSAQSSGNKYVQYRLMSDTFNTTITNWQGIDDKPTVESDNLVKSGGVKEELDNKFKEESIVPFAIVDSESKKIIWFDGKKVHLCDSDFLKPTESDNGLNIMVYADKNNIPIYRIRANGYSDADLEIKMMLTNLLSDIIGYPSIEYMSEGFAEVYARTISGIEEIDFKKDTIDIDGIKTNYVKTLCDINGNIINSISI